MPYEGCIEGYIVVLLTFCETQLYGLNVSDKRKVNVTIKVFD